MAIKEYGELAVVDQGVADCEHMIRVSQLGISHKYRSRASVPQHTAPVDFVKK